ncbi:hypothetical protein [Belliella pelovolcani]|uniref:O-Antigen ligase n=1 Tax=Belliella pelovolcani TaxID=529505 RepID=A0A1N7MEC1_9BACT|nr:hypothetical protein [Belliella pelovolcani]SIS84456.1 hypothetical protein SAMN05421761_10615 [Belliella pelovolcani]
MIKIDIRSFKINFFLYVAFFALGLNKISFYLPIFTIWIFFTANKLLNGGISKNFALLSSLFLITIVPIFSFGFNRLKLDNPYLNFSAIMFSLIVVGYIFQVQNRQRQIKLLICFIFGMGFEALIITIYSFFTDPIIYGYGLLIDPFTKIEINSPSVSNSLAIFSTVLLFFLFKGSNKKIKLVVLVLFLTCLVSGVFLGGRTFFIIIFLSLLLLISYDLTLFQFLKLLSFFMIFTICLLYLFNNSDFFSLYVEFSLTRFEKGLESTRSRHYAHGMEQLLYYPFGGFEVDTSIEKTYWFHNVFLDNARLAGWIPSISLFFAILFIFISSFKYKRLKSLSFFIFFITFLILQQDVVIEGNYRSLIIVYLSGVLLVSRNKK